MLKNPLFAKLLWVGFALAVAAAIMTWMLNPNVPVKGLAWGLLGFAWFKVLLIKDIQWQRQHRPGNPDRGELAPDHRGCGAADHRP